VLSGNREGQILLVVSNTADTLTVSAQAGDDPLESGKEIVSGDTLALSPAWTLETFLPVAALPDGVFFLTFDGGSGINMAATKQYYIYNGKWNDLDTFSPANPILYPGESYVVRNQTATDIMSLTVSGEVSPAKHHIVLVGGATAQQDTRFGYMGPVTEMLDDAGVPAVDGDFILFFDNTTTGINKAASKQYYYFGGQWNDLDTFAPPNPPVGLIGGEGYVFRTAAAAVDKVWSDEQSYYGTL